MLNWDTCGDSARNCFFETPTYGHEVFLKQVIIKALDSLILERFGNIKLWFLYMDYTKGDVNGQL